MFLVGFVLGGISAVFGLFLICSFWNQAQIEREERENEIKRRLERNDNRDINRNDD